MNNPEQMPPQEAQHHNDSKSERTISFDPNGVQRVSTSRKELLDDLEAEREK